MRGAQVFATKRMGGASNKRVSGAMLLLRVQSTLLLLTAALLPAFGVNRAVSEPAESHATADGPHTHIELLVPQSALNRNGEPNTAGLHFKLEPGWHVYWKNAGDS